MTLKRRASCAISRRISTKKVSSTEEQSHFGKNSGRKILLAAKPRTEREHRLTSSTRERSQFENFSRTQTRTTALSHDGQSQSPDILRSSGTSTESIRAIVERQHWLANCGAEHLRQRMTRLRRSSLARRLQTGTLHLNDPKSHLNPHKLIFFCVDHCHLGAEKFHA